MIRIKSGNQVVAEIPIDKFPLTVEEEAVSRSGSLNVRHYTLSVVYWLKENYDKDITRPKGMKLT